MTRISTFQHDGLVFDVTDQGPLDGDVVVLLHGFPQTAASWDRLAPLLHDQGYRTLAPDQRGYSSRARPRGRYAYRLSALTADITALITAASPDGRKVHVIGHDWGAAVTWALAAERPDLIATMTALSVPHPAAFTLALFSSRQFLMSWYMFLFQLPWLPELAIRRQNPGKPSRAAARMTAGQTPANAARDAAFLIHSGALTPALNWYRAMPFSTPRHLTKVAIPTLHINSDADPTLHTRGAELTRRFVTGPYTHHTLAGIGHWIPEQAPGQVAELLRPHLDHSPHARR